MTVFRWVAMACIVTGTVQAVIAVFERVWPR